MGFKLALSVFLLLSVVIIDPTLARTSETSLLSYSELMRLPVDQRVQYIDEVQKMLVEISKSPGHFSDSDPKSRSRLKVWLEILQNEIPNAHARASGIPRCEHESKCLSAMEKCDQQDFEVKWNGNAYVCDKAKKIIREPGMSRYESFARRRVTSNDPRAEAERKNEVSPIVVRPAISQEGSVIPRVNAVVPQHRLFSTEQRASTTIEAYVRGRLESGSIGCKSIHQQENIVGRSELTECTPAAEASIKSEFEKQRPKFAPNFAPKTEQASIPPREPPVVEAPVGASTVPDAEVSHLAPIELRISPLTTNSAPNDQAAFTIPLPPRENTVAVPLSSSSSSSSSVSTTSQDISPEISQDEIQKLLLQKTHPEVLCIDEAKKAGGGKMNLVQIEGTNTRYCMTERGEQLYRDKKWRPGDGNSASREARALKSSQSVLPAGGAPALACAPVPMTCTNSRDLRAKAFQGNQKCVFAGMISKLQNGNRRCEAITEFELSGTMYKCNRGQSMCNPLLFGSVSSTKPICVGRGNDVTVQCSKISTARDAEKFINRNVSGLQEKWDDFVRELNSLCKPDTDSANFHCVECNIMQARVFEMNARVLADVCGSPLIGTDAIGARIKIRSAVPAKEKKTAN